MSKDKCSVCNEEALTKEFRGFRFGTCSKECARMAVLCKTITALFPARFADGAPCIRVEGRVDGLVKEVGYIPIARRPNKRKGE